MPCFSPLQAWQMPWGGKLYFSAPAPHPKAKLLTVPCGRCIGCRLERARQWAMRCCYESFLYEDNCFVTLTYNEANLPLDMSLKPKHLQLFIKRLRKRLAPLRVRFFACGEYGEQNFRPHYHLILFGYSFLTDAEQLRTDGHQLVYYSPLLAELWPFGFSSVGEFSFESAAYVARYCLKKVTGNQAAEHYGDRVPEFLRCSNRPGIGAGWLEEFCDDVYSDDKCFARGLPCKPPRYFDKKLELISPEKFAKVKANREVSASLIQPDPIRLNTARVVVERKLAQFSRTV